MTSQQLDDICRVFGACNYKALQAAYNLGYADGVSCARSKLLDICHQLRDARAPLESVDEPT